MFLERGVQLVAISTDGMGDARNMATLSGATYPVIPDPDTRISRSYGVFDLLGDGVAAPAVFVIASTGEIAWRYIGRDIADRPTTAEILGKLP